MKSSLYYQTLRAPVGWTEAERIREACRRGRCFACGVRLEAYASGLDWVHRFHPRLRCRKTKEARATVRRLFKRIRGSHL